MSVARTSIVSIYPKTIHPTKMEDRATLASRMFQVTKTTKEWPFGKEPLQVSRNVIQHWKYYGKVPADMDIKETNRIVDLIELDMNRRQALKDEKIFLREESDFEYGYEDRVQVAIWLDQIANIFKSEYPYLGPKLFISKEDLHNWSQNTNEQGERRGLPKRYDALAILEAAYEILMTPKRPILFKTHAHKALETEIYENLLRFREETSPMNTEKDQEIESLKAAVRVLEEKIQELKKES